MALLGSAITATDYANYYGAWPIQEAAKLERSHNPQPAMAVDLSKLGLSEKLLEENGINLGANQQATPYWDMSGRVPKAGLFQHTATTHQHVNPIPAHPLGVPSSMAVARSPASWPKAANHLLVEQYIAALQAGDEPGMGSASRAFAASDRGQQIAAEAEQRILAWQQKLPGRDNPLFAQALQHLERLGSQAGGYLDRIQMEQIAGAVAYQARLNHMPTIDALVETRDGQGLTATWTSPNNDMIRSHATVDKIQALMQPLDQSLQQLADETQRQEQQALIQAQRQVEAQQTNLSR